MKKLFYLLAVLALCIPVIAQEADKSEDSETSVDVINDQVYTESIIEDFETNVYSKENGSLRVTKDQKFDIQMRDAFPAPVRGSKKYMGIKIYGRIGDALTITPPKNLEIKDHVQSISIWVNGKNFTGNLTLVIKDANNRTHCLNYGKLNFLGWRKLTYKLTSDIAQEDKYLAQPRSLRILKLIYRPGNAGRLPIWNYLYIDNISAKVRKKYVDRQSDDW